MRSTARIADLLLIAFLVCVAFAVAAQVRHNVAHHGPRDHPVARHRHTPATGADRATARPGSPQNYLTAAEAAYTRSRVWWDPRRGWYRQFLPGHGRSLATMWGIVHLFGATNAIALADPTPAHRAAARRFADGAERYWNPELRPVPAYGPSPLGLGPHRRTWYDDEAWWGVAFWDAYRATHDRRYLRSAARSLRFIDSGWDPRRGGIYWDTRHTFKASESLAGGTLTAAGLYETTHDPHYLALARKYIRWADRTIKARDGLYGGRSTPAVPMAYVEGPMAEALVRLCHATGRTADCAEGERLMRTTANHFRVLAQGPQMDAIYIRSVVQLYRLDHNPRWYRIATTAANEAIAHAADAHGRYLKMWDGRPIRVIGTPPDKLQIHAATTSVLAWVAAAHPRRRPPG